MPTPNKITQSAIYTAPARVSWHLHGRWFDIDIPLQNGSFSRTRLVLEDMVRMCRISREELQAVVDELETAPRLLHPGSSGADESAEFSKMRLEAIPQDLTGKTALDIGGWDGAMSKECLERGATQAICFDNEQWRDYTWKRPAEFPGVIYKRGDLMNFDHNPAPPSDVVIFFNVLYHIRDPWLALERCRLLTRETFVLCTSFIEGTGPMWRIFSEEDEDAPQGVINDHYTVFWKPTVEGLLKMLKNVGFKDLQTFGPVGDHICVRCSV